MALDLLGWVLDTVYIFGVHYSLVPHLQQPTVCVIYVALLFDDNNNVTFHLSYIPLLPFYTIVIQY